MRNNLNLLQNQYVKIIIIALFLLAKPTAVKAMTIHEAAQSGDVPAILTQLNAGVNVDLQIANFQYWTPLYCAVMLGQTEAARCLLMHGAAVNKKIKEQKGCTALHFAAAAGNAPIINLLLDYHAYVDQEDSSNLTPLFHAVLWHQKEAIEALIAHGANVRYKTRNGLEPRYVIWSAGPVGGEEIEKLLHKYIERPERPRILALAAAIHPRLGQHSPARILSADIYHRIFRFLCGDDEHEWGTFLIE